MSLPTLEEALAEEIIRSAKGKYSERDLKGLDRHELKKILDKIILKEE